MVISKEFDYIRSNLPFWRLAGSGGVGFGGEVFSGFTVRAATAAGLRAGSVARLALSLSLGAASSSGFILLASVADSSDRLVESSESLRHMASRFLVEEDKEDVDLG